MLQLKTWGAKGASNHSAFTGKWLTVISLIHPEDELSFKEMRMWGQSKISSCDSIEMESRGESKITNTMVESFSADLLSAIKSYWTESPFELGILLGD